MQPLHPGSSGGPLLSPETADVLGLIDLGTTDANGLAFAVSARVASQLLAAWRESPQPIANARCDGGTGEPIPIAADCSSRGVSVPAVYSGCFTSVDRLQRCYAIDDGAFCTSGPSGMSVTLVAGLEVSFDGITRSEDLGGNSMEMGTSFQTPAGTVACDSSSRGITCVDLTLPGNYFVIGDHYVRIANDGYETRYDD